MTWMTNMCYKIKVRKITNEYERQRNEESMENGKRYETVDISKIIISETKK